jgi:hypothetical protein
MRVIGVTVLLSTIGFTIGGCGDSAATTDAPASIDSTGGTVDSAGSGCTLAADTTPTSTVSASGCAVLTRDTSACDAARATAGVTGFWLHMSCRVSLAISETDGTLTATSDGRPDYVSNYFPTTDPCHETYTGAIQNPNLIAVQTIAVPFPLVPSGTPAAMRGAIVGIALDGVPIFANFAAPGDDIYQEAMTFDRCGGHPQNTGEYHFHGEPYSISDADDHFIGVMRDGNPVYGRLDSDGSMPSDLDADGGHTGTTPDSPTTPVYHYHVNLQTSTATTSAGEQQWFLTTGMYHNAAPNCSDCN